MKTDATLSPRRLLAPFADQQLNRYQISDILGAIIVVAAMVHGVLFALVLARTIILRPFSDMISYIDFYLQEREQHVGLLEYLWAPHTEHHLPMIRILTALDVSTFHAGGAPFVIAATAALVATALLVFLELYRSQYLSGPLRSLALLGPMLLLTSAAALDCSIPINSVYPLTLVFIIAALVLFDGEAELTRLSTTRRVGALVMATVASLSNAAGLVAWPALLWVAWRGGAGWRWLLAIAMVATCYGFIYVHDIPSNAFNDPHFIGFAHLAKMGEYLLAYLGLPLWRAFHLPGLVLGGSLLVVGSVAMLGDAISRRPAARLQRLALGWVMMALAAALLVAVGRVDQEAEVNVPIRYALFVAPLHIGVLALALSYLASRATTPRRQAVLLGAAAIFATGLLTLQIAGGRAATAVAATITRTIERYDAGIREPGMEKLIFPDLATADRVLATLRQMSGRSQ